MYLVLVSLYQAISDPVESHVHSCHQLFLFDGLVADSRCTGIICLDLNCLLWVVHFRGAICSGAVSLPLLKTASVLALVSGNIMAFMMVMQCICTAPPFLGGCSASGLGVMSRDLSLRNRSVEVQEYIFAADR